MPAETGVREPDSMPAGAWFGYMAAVAVVVSLWIAEFLSIRGLEAGPARDTKIAWMVTLASLLWAMAIGWPIAIFACRARQGWVREK